MSLKGRKASSLLVMCILLASTSSPVAPRAAAGSPVIPGLNPRHMAGMLPTTSANPTLAQANYDEQLGVTFTQNFTSMSYTVTAVAQTDPNTGTGPAYLLNGFSSAGYWYQVGLSWDWTPGFGFAMSFEVFNPSGSSIYPTSGGGGLLGFLTPVDSGNQVLLSLTFSGGNVVMSATDLSTGAKESTSYSAFGSTLFVGQPSGPATAQGFFTGLMTEWYHANAYYGDSAHEVYTQSKALTSGWMWMDEFNVVTSALTFATCYNSCSAPITWSPPSTIVTFSSNGAHEGSNAYEFYTGLLGAPVSVSMSYSVEGGGIGYQPPTLHFYWGGAPQSVSLTTSSVTYSMDSGSQWIVSGELTGSNSNERWQTNQTVQGTASAPQAYDFTYFHQDLVTFSTGVLGGGSGFSPPDISYGYYGSSTSAQVGSTVWADAGSNYTATNPLQGSNIIERWFAGRASGPVSSPGLVNITYYHQFIVSFGYTIVGGGNPNPPAMNGIYLGQLKSLPLTSWLDAGTTYQIPGALKSNSATERWNGYNSSGTVTSRISGSLVYYHQFVVSVSYAVAGGGTAESPTFTFDMMGVSTGYVGTTVPTQMWVDAAGWNISAALPGSTSSERWATRISSGSVNSSIVIAPLYFHQFALTASFSVSDGSSPVPPSLSSVSFGASNFPSMFRNPSVYWLDFGTTWSVNFTLTGSGAAERWITAGPLFGSASSAQTISVLYLHQFYVTVGSIEADGGVTSGSRWANASAPFQLLAAANTGWKFERWSGSGNGSYSGTISSAQFPLLGPIIENATFYPGLTFNNGGNGYIQLSWPGNKSSFSSTSATVYVPVGTNVSLTASPASLLFVFGGYTGALNSTKATGSIVLSSPMSVTGSFAANYPVVGGLVGISAVVIIAAAYYLWLRKPN